MPLDFVSWRTIYLFFSRCDVICDLLQYTRTNKTSIYTHKVTVVKRLFLGAVNCRNYITIYIYIYITGILLFEFKNIYKPPTSASQSAQQHQSEARSVIVQITDTCLAVPQLISVAWYNLDMAWQPFIPKRLSDIYIYITRNTCTQQPLAQGNDLRMQIFAFSPLFKKQ